MKNFSTIYSFKVDFSTTNQQIQNQDPVMVLIVNYNWW